MLRLISPNESHPLTLEIDDASNPTIVWVRPMTERDAARARLSGRGEDGKSLTSPSVFDKLCDQITKIENVRWNGECPFATDDPATIKDIMFAWPSDIMKAWAIRIFGFCTLDEKHVKNSDGSSAYIDMGLPLVAQTGITGASQKAGPSSGSQASATAPSSTSGQ